jgi:hypothetical protein
MTGIFKKLADNAFDFLERAVLELTKYPKFSLINFYSGVELLLKARLIKEHWSLIIMQPGIADMRKFSKGDFQSVGLIECLKRLDNICGDPLDKRAITAFTTLRDHRNMAVHFAHHDYIKGNKEIISTIAREQLISWYFISNLLVRKWKKYFKSYQRRVDTITEKIKSHTDYLDAKFEALQGKLNKLKNSGINITTCPVCSYKSCQYLQGPFDLKKYSCLVCEIKFNSLVIQCPECYNKFYYDGYDPDLLVCDSCGNAISLDNILDNYDPTFHDDDLVGESRAYCGSCEYYEQPTVVSDVERALCFACLTEFDGSEIDQCQYCGTNCAGINLEFSYLNGCVVCDGKDPDKL